MEKKSSFRFIGISRARTKCSTIILKMLSNNVPHNRNISLEKVNQIEGKRKGKRKAAKKCVCVRVRVRIQWSTNLVS